MLARFVKPSYLVVPASVLKTFVDSDSGRRCGKKIGALLVVPDGRVGDVSLSIPILQCWLEDAYAKYVRLPVPLLMESAR